METKSFCLELSRRILSLSWVASSLLLLLLITAGCQNPMGLSKKEWQALSPEQQAEYRRQQALIDEQRRQERAALAEQQRLEAAERARQEEIRLAELYANARYGDIVLVSIEGGQVNFSRQSAYEPLRFEILRGQRKEIEFSELGNPSNKARVPVRLSEDGQTFYFDENARDRIVLINTGNTWQGGKRYDSLAVRDSFSKSLANGINIHLQYKSFGPPRNHTPQAQPLTPPSQTPQRPAPTRPLSR